MAKARTGERRTGTFGAKRSLVKLRARDGKRSLKRILSGVDDGSITVEQAVEELDQLKRSRSTRIERFFNALVS